MKKALKIGLIVALSVILTVALLALALIARIGYAFGLRFSPEAAAEAVSIHMSELSYIEGENCRFYYRTVEDIYGDLLADPTAAHGEWLYDIMPVTRDGLFWQARTVTGGASICREGDDQRVGYLQYIKVDGKYHCFIVPELRPTEPPYGWTPPYEFTADFDSAVVDGTETELFMHSYFVTDEKVTELELGGTIYEVK